MLLKPNTSTSKLWVGGSIPTGQTNIHELVWRFKVFILMVEIFMHLPCKLIRSSDF